MVADKKLFQSVAVFILTNQIPSPLTGEGEGRGRGSFPERGDVASLDGGRRKTSSFLVVHMRHSQEVKNGNKI
jgi:hypothetical protein